MLEEHIILVRGTSNTAEDVAPHEVVDVGSKPIDDLDIVQPCVLCVRPSAVSGMHAAASCTRRRATHIVVIPDIDLSNLAVRGCERVGVVPPDVILQVPVIASLAQLLPVGVGAPLLGIADVGPVAQWPANADTVIVYLIASAEPV